MGTTTPVTVTVPLSRNVGGSYTAHVNLTRVPRLNHCIACSIQRNVYQIEQVNVKLQRDKMIAESVSGDLQRNVMLNGLENFSVKTMRIVRNKPHYRYVNNIGEPFTYPDGKPISGMQLTFVLTGGNGDTMAAVDDATGDIVNNHITVYTDEFGEFSARLWPNNRSSMESWYRVYTDSRFVREGLIYVPDAPHELKFSEAYKHMNAKYFTRIHAGMPFILEVRPQDYVPFDIMVTTPAIADISFELTPSYKDTAGMPFSMQVTKI